MDEELAQKAEADIFQEFETIEMTETGLGKPSEELELNLGDDVVELEELDPFAEDFEMDGETFVQDAKPSEISKVDWDTLDAEALEEKAFQADIEGMYDVGEAVVESAEIVAESAEVALESVEVAEAVGEAVLISAEVGAGAIAGAISGAVAGAALMIGMTIFGNYLLKKYKASIIPEFADDNPWNGSLGYVVLGKIWCPCYLNLVEQQKDRYLAYVHYYDMTHFPRSVTLWLNDPTLQLLQPQRKGGYFDMTEEVPFYKEFPVGTRVKMLHPPYKGKTGTIRRTMIMDPDNTDGSYDKYKIEIDGVIDGFYEAVYNFEIYDNKYVPKHYAKSQVSRKRNGTAKMH